MSPDFNTIIMTNKIYKDNSELFSSSINEMLMEAFGSATVICIPCEKGDVTGHIDSMCRWVSNYKIIINSYAGDFRNKIFKYLEAKLSENVRIIEIPYAPSTGIMSGFPTAKGCYLNFLLTSRCCVIPLFCNAKNDHLAVEIISKHVSVPVITVTAEPISIYGGAVNCVTWHYRCI